MYMGVVYVKAVADLGLLVTGLGLCASLGYLALGQVMLDRQRAPNFLRSLLLAILFPSGLVLSNARATYEAFASREMVFNRTPKAGAAYAGGWRGSPEIAAGLLLPVFALAEQAWSAPFFVFAAAGLLAIGGMGWTSALQVPARSRAIEAVQKN